MGNNAPTQFKCEIHLDNACGVFLPEDVITGHVFVGANQRVTVDNCILWCYGRAKTRWEASRQTRGLVSGDDLAWLSLALTKGSNGTAARALSEAGISCVDGSAINRPLSSLAASMNSLAGSTATKRDKRKRRGACQVLFCTRLDLDLASPATAAAMAAASCQQQPPSTAVHFRFCLPANLPSSFELPAACLAGGSVASVAYNLRLELRCSQPTLVHIVRHPFRVLRSLQLADLPTLTVRVTLHREFRPCPNPLLRHSQCLTSSDPILCDLAVNKTGFVPGESLMACVNIKNGSAQPIKMVHLSLLQRVKMLGQNESQNSVEFIRVFAAVLKNLTVPPSHPQTSEAAVPVAGSGYFVETIHVPPLPASQSSSIIQIGYLLLLRLQLSRRTTAKNEFRMHIPITIGTDPAKSTSFLEGKEVSPCYASFDFSTGSIREANSHDCNCPVYLYFRATAVSNLTSTLSPTTCSLRTALDTEGYCGEGPRRSHSAAVAVQEQPPPLPARQPPARVKKGLSWEPSAEDAHRTADCHRFAVTRYNSETHLRATPAVTAVTPQLRDKLYFDDGELLAQPSSGPSAFCSASPSSTTTTTSSSSSSLVYSYELSPPSPACLTLPDRPKRVHSAHVQCSATATISSKDGGSEVIGRVASPAASARRLARTAGNPLRHSIRRQDSDCSSDST